MNRYYTGIGSRKTPESILEIFIVLGEWLARRGYKLRSGRAPGADYAFEKGADKVGNLKDIYLPWKGFEDSNSNLYIISQGAIDIARKYHKGYDKLSQGAQKLMARNSYQVLGSDLITPTMFIICYTPKGKGSGGTGQALRIANDFNIPIFDAGLYENDIDLLKERINEFLKKVM